jgi:hypothetical protein
MQIILQRKLGIKAANLIVHIKRKTMMRDTESGAAQTARLVVNHPNPRTHCGCERLAQSHDSLNARRVQ